MIQPIRNDTVKDSELAAGNGNACAIFSAQCLLQKLDLTTSIDLEIGARIAVKVATWEDMQLLRLSGFCIRLEGNVSRAKHIVFGHGHQQGSRRDTMDHMRRVVGAEQFDAVGFQSLVLPLNDRNTRRNKVCTFSR